MIGCPDWEKDWQWIASPTGHIESGNRFWTNPELTYDGNCDTRGNVYVNKDSPFTATNRITWLFDNVEAEGVRLAGFVTGTRNNECWCFVRAEVDGQLIPLLPWELRALDPARVWEFPRGILTKFIIQVDFLEYGHAQLYVSEIAAGVKSPVCPGPLGQICKLIRDVGQFFTGLAGDIQGVFIIGEYLAQPFRSLGALFESGADTCCATSAALQEIFDLLEGGISWDEISAMIVEHWPGLAPLIVDPLGYITAIVSDLIPDLPDWLDDPLAWLIATLQEHFPLLYYLVVDPKDQVLYLIGQAFDLTPYEAQSGEFIVKTLFERYFPELYLVWRDPVRWLVDTLLALEEEIVRPIADKLQSLGEHLLRLMWEGEW